MLNLQQVLHNTKRKASGAMKDTGQSKDRLREPDPEANSPPGMDKHQGVPYPLQDHESITQEHKAHTGCDVEEKGCPPHLPPNLLHGHHVMFVSTCKPPSSSSYPLQLCKEPFPNSTRCAIVPWIGRGQGTSIPKRRTVVVNRQPLITAPTGCPQHLAMPPLSHDVMSAVPGNLPAQLHNGSHPTKANGSY